MKDLNIYMIILKYMNKKSKESLEKLEKCIENLENKRIHLTIKYHNKINKIETENPEKYIEEKERIKNLYEQKMSSLQLKYSKLVDRFREIYSI